MAKIATPKIYGGVLRGPLSSEFQKSVSGNPFETAAKQLKPQFPVPKVPRAKLPGPPRRTKGNPFFGE